MNTRTLKLLPQSLPHPSAIALPRAPPRNRGAASVVLLPSLFPVLLHAPPSPPRAPTSSPLLSVSLPSPPPLLSCSGGAPFPLPSPTSPDPVSSSGASPTLSSSTGDAWGYHLLQRMRIWRQDLEVRRPDLNAWQRVRSGRRIATSPSNGHGGPLAPLPSAAASPMADLPEMGLSSVDLVPRARR